MAHFAHNRSFRLNDLCLIGRDLSCDIVLSRRFVSRRHARIERVITTYFIEDLESNCGTLVNGQRLTGYHELEDGDEIRIGNYVLYFKQNTLFELSPGDRR